MRSKIESLPRHMMSIYESLNSQCSSILHINRKIQSVAFINNKVRPLETLSRPGYVNPLPDNMTEMFFMQCVLQISMGRDFDEQYGPINYHVSERANMTMITFPMDNHVILLTASKDISPIHLAKKVVTVINDYRKKMS